MKVWSVVLTVQPIEAETEEEAVAAAKSSIDSPFLCTAEVEEMEE